MPDRGWSGSNHDVGSFSEVDEELRHRILIQDDNLRRVHEAEEAYLAAMEEYLPAYAETVASCPSDWPTARKEREAKTVHYKFRIKYEKAKLAWEAAKLYASVQEGLINAVQSRGANVRKQADLEVAAHAVMGEVRNNPKSAQSYRPLDMDCAECGLVQYDTPSGPCCENGHGGAEGVPVKRKRRPF